MGLEVSWVADWKRTRGTGQKNVWKEGFGKRWLKERAATNRPIN